MKLFESKIRSVELGLNCTVIEPANLYECKLGNNVFVGPFVEIQKGVEIGDFTKISSHSFICELVKIGKRCFIGHGVMFTNDKFSSGKIFPGKDHWIETRIGDDVLIGSNATILPVNISDGIVIGAGSVVTKDLKIKGIYAGNPAKIIREL